VTDGVYDTLVLRFQEFKNNPIGTFSEPRQAPEFAFERRKFRGVKIGRKPLKPIDNPFCHRSIELLKLY
jgi:hypothetical protein